jgi:hypothetical protein
MKKTEAKFLLYTYLEQFVGVKFDPRPVIDERE